MQKDLLYKTSYRVNTEELTGAELDVCSSWDYYFVSGGTTITGIIARWPGMQVCLEFLDETTLTHSTTLKLPNDANLVAEVGSVYRFIQTTNTGWKCVSAGGTSGGGSISDAAYGDNWDEVVSTGASKNALYDKLSTVADNGDNYDITAMHGMEDNVIIGGELTGTSMLATTTNLVAIGEDACRGSGGHTGSVIVGAQTSATSSFDYSVAIGYNINTTILNYDLVQPTRCTYLGSSIVTGETSPEYEIIIGCSAVGNGEYTATYGSDDIRDSYIMGTIHADEGQIQFPSTQNKSTNVNTLDDYEEGTFTPALKFAGNSVGMTYAIQLGTYTKIGNVIHFEIDIEISDKGTSTGDCAIYYLPWDCSSGSYRACSMWLQYITYTTIPVCYLRPDDDVIRVAEYTNNGQMSRLDDTAFSDTARLVFTGHYTID